MWRVHRGAANVRTTKKSSRTDMRKKKRGRKRPAAPARACARLRSRAVVAGKAAGGYEGGDMVVAVPRCRTDDTSIRDMASVNKNKYKIYLLSKHRILLYTDCFTMTTRLTCVCSGRAGCGPEPRRAAGSWRGIRWLGPALNML